MTMTVVGWLSALEKRQVKEERSALQSKLLYITNLHYCKLECFDCIRVDDDEDDKRAYG